MPKGLEDGGWVLVGLVSELHTLCCAQESSSKYWLFTKTAGAVHSPAFHRETLIRGKRDTRATAELLSEPLPDVDQHCLS